MNPAVLKSKKVVGSEGYILGEMGDLHFDLEKWQAIAFYVALSAEAAEELDLKKLALRKIMVCLPIKLIKTVGDVVELTTPVRSIKDVADEEMCVEPVKVVGKKVISMTGYEVGNIEAVDVDFGSWRINGLQVGLTDNAAMDLGFKRPFMSKVVVIIPPSAVGEIGKVTIAS